MGTYFTSLSKLWHELDLVDDFLWKCTEDCKRFKVRINKEHIYDFLVGLNQDLDVVRNRILAIKNKLKKYSLRYSEKRHTKE